MSWDVNYEEDGIDPGNLENRIPEGKYLVRISEVDDPGGDSAMVIHWEILTGTNPDQEGRTGKERFLKSPKAKVRALALAVATGNHHPRGNGKRTKAAGRSTALDFSQAIEKTLVVQIVHQVDDSDSSKKWVNWGFLAMWHPSHPEAAEVPKAEATQEVAGF